MFSKTSGFRNLQEQIFDKEGIKVRPVCTAEEIEVITGLVENGFGISVLPYMDIIRHHNIVAIPVQTSIWKSKFYIARRKYGIRSDQEEAFFQYWRKNRLWRKYCGTAQSANPRSAAIRDYTCVMYSPLFKSVYFSHSRTITSQLSSFSISSGQSVWFWLDRSTFFTGYSSLVETASRPKLAATRTRCDFVSR